MRPIAMIALPGAATARIPCAAKNHHNATDSFTVDSSTSTTQTARLPRMGTSLALFTTPRTQTLAPRGSARARVVALSTERGVRASSQATGSVQTRSATVVVPTLASASRAAGPRPLILLTGSSHLQPGAGSTRDTLLEAHLEDLVRPLAAGHPHLHLVAHFLAEQSARQWARDAQDPLVDVSLVGAEDPVG